MTAIEILATIGAIWILVKLLIYMINPKLSMKAAEAMLKKRAVATVAYLILAVIVGYYVLASLNIVQVMAVMLFTSILIGLSLLPYSESMLEIVKEMSTTRSDMFRKNWLIMLIWVAIAIWTLYAVFA